MRIEEKIFIIWWAVGVEWYVAQMNFPLQIISLFWEVSESTNKNFTFLKIGPNRQNHAQQNCNTAWTLKIDSAARVTRLGDFFAQSEIVYIGQFFENYRSSPHF
jgi:hypothetical protein